jgi:hypothetical protein
VSTEQGTGQRCKLQNSSKTLLKEKVIKSKEISLPEKKGAPIRVHRSIDFIFILFCFEMQSDRNFIREGKGTKGKERTLM